MRVSFSHVSHAVYIFKLTVRLSLPYSLFVSSL